MFLVYLIAYIVPLSLIALGIFIIIISKRAGEKFIRRCSTELKGECTNLKTTFIPGLVKPEYAAVLDNQKITISSKLFVIQKIANRKVGDKVTLHIDRASLNDFYINDKKPINKLIGIIIGSIIIAGGTIWIINLLIQTIAVL